MKLENIGIKAGKGAIKHLEKNGFNPSDVGTIAAAAGGPKWFVIYHLTKYIGEHILPLTTSKINLIGSSIGAWQMACLASKDPGAALNRLRNNYAKEKYNFPITTSEVSRGCFATLSKTFSKDDVEHILHSKKTNLSIFCDRGKGPMNSNNPTSVRMGLLAASLTNILSRRTLNMYLKRYVYSTHDQLPYAKCPYGLKTQLRPLNNSNLYNALMATAAIPMLMNGVKIETEKAVFWDGGLLDYHCVLNYKKEGLVIIPHFISKLIPGWLDKYLLVRKGNNRILDNVIMIYPSKSYISKLPKKKITSKKDFTDFGLDQKGRADYWITVSDKSKEMADELHEVLYHPNLTSLIKSF